MNWSESVYETQSDTGEMLRGILTVPEQDDSGVVLILLPAGLKDRVGPHRLYVHVARLMASYGITVLRLDAMGIGESDGELDFAFNGKHYRSIQSGLFVADCLAVMNDIDQRMGRRKFILGGLCGGAISAQLVAAKSVEEQDVDRVLGVLSWSHVAVLDSEEPSARGATRSEVVSNSRSYIRKVFSPHAWQRILRGESSFTSIFSNVASIFSLLLEKSGLVRLHWANENPLFFSSFRQLQHAGVKHLMIFGERDARWTAFKELVVDGFLSGSLNGKGYQIKLIKDANHEFHLQDWSRLLMTSSLGWVMELSGMPYTDLTQDERLAVSAATQVAIMGDRS